MSETSEDKARAGEAWRCESGNEVEIVAPREARDGYASYRARYTKVVAGHYRLGSEHEVYESCLHERLPRPAPATKSIGATCAVCGESEATGGKAVRAQGDGRRVCDGCTRKCKACPALNAPERIVGKHRERVRLCDPCAMGIERVTAPVAPKPEPVKVQTWAPGCGPGTMVKMGMELVGGWNRKVPR